MVSAVVLVSVAMGPLALAKRLPLQLLIVVFVANMLIGPSKHDVSDVAAVTVLAAIAVWLMTLFCT
eukprot:4724862-Ditylum_brightwellii.AAC.1